MGKEQSLEEMVLRKPDTCVQTNGVRPLLLFSCSVRSDSLWPHGLQHARLPCPSPSPGACSNSCPLSQWCDPMDYTAHGILQARILEWIAIPFSRGSFQPRDWTQVFHIAGKFFTSWATREAKYPVFLDNLNPVGGSNDFTAEYLTRAYNLKIYLGAEEIYLLSLLPVITLYHPCS